LRILLLPGMRSWWYAKRGLQKAYRKVVSAGDTHKEDLHHIQ